MARFNGMGSAQYFDNSGEPLSGGLLYFYESGSTTPKTTYSDADQSIPNANPVVLDAAGRQGDIFFSGSAKMAIHDVDDAQIDVIDPIGGAVTRDAFADWNALITYDGEDIVQGSDERYYKAVTNDNIGNDPTTETANWMEVKFIAIWNAAYTYEAGNLVIGPDDALYNCTAESSLNNNPYTEGEDWTAIGASGWSSLVEDTSPQLGGDLDPNGNDVGDASAADLTKLSEITATSSELNALDGITANVTELNVLDGITATTTELNYTDGVTSAIQTQLNAKAPSSAPTFSGTITLPNSWTIVAGSTTLDFKKSGVTIARISTAGGGRIYLVDHLYYEQGTL